MGAKAKEEGLGGRYLNPEHGMLFDFTPPQPLKFWMKCCYIALDIIFINAKVVQISQLAAAPASMPDSLIPWAVVSEPVSSVLELLNGTASKYGVTVGDTISVKDIASPELMPTGKPL